MRRTPQAARRLSMNAATVSDMAPPIVSRPATRAAAAVAANRRPPNNARPSASTPWRSCSCGVGRAQEPLVPRALAIAQVVIAERSLALASGVAPERAAPFPAEGPHVAEAPDRSVGRNPSQEPADRLFADVGQLGWRNLDAVLDALLVEGGHHRLLWWTIVQRYRSTIER